MKTKPTLLLLLALVAALRMSAADAPNVLTITADNKPPEVLLTSTPEKNGRYEVFKSTREPIVSKTADGQWEIHFDDPKENSALTKIVAIIGLSAIVFSGVAISFRIAAKHGSPGIY